MVRSCRQVIVCNIYPLNLHTWYYTAEFLVSTGSYLPGALWLSLQGQIWILITYFQGKCRPVRSVNSFVILIKVVVNLEGPDTTVCFVFIFPLIDFVYALLHLLQYVFIHCVQIANMDKQLCIFCQLKVDINTIMTDLFGILCMFSNSSYVVQILVYMYNDNLTMPK